MLGTQVVSTSGSFASDVPALTTGRVVRVSVLEEDGQSSNTRTIRGELLSMSQNQIALEGLPSGEPVFIPRDQIAMIELSVRSSRRPIGAAIGFGFGVLCGAVIGASTGDDRNDPEDEPLSWQGGQKAVTFGVIFGLAGAVVGALVAPGERWWVLPPEQWRLDLDSNEGGGGMMSLNYRF